MTRNEIMLGEYKLVLDNAYWMAYYVYLHNEMVGSVGFLDDMSLYAIGTNDKKLISLLLGKYQQSPLLTIYPVGHSGDGGYYV